MKRNISKLLTIILLVIVLLPFSGCKKDPQGESTDGKQEVSFLIFNKSGNQFNPAPKISGVIKPKSPATITDTIHCPPEGVVANYAKAIIDGEEYKIDIFYTPENGVEIPHTNTIYLTPGDHILSEFITYFDSNTPGDESDDVILAGAPHTGAAFATYVDNPLENTFTVTKELKTDVSVEVLCYEAQNFSDFGFAYFSLDELTVRTKNFFGDFCIKKKSDYNGSWYTEQVNWNGGGQYIDAPAIAMVEVWRKQDNGAWVKQWKNATEADFKNSHQGETIKVTYGDYKTRVDSFEFKLFIYVRQGTSFGYKYFTSWKFKDNQDLLYTVGSNGGKTTYYCLGSCDPNANYIMPAYINLAPTATYKIEGPMAPGSLGGYVNAHLTDIPSGYEFGNGLYASNCADHTALITPGQPYDMNMYCSWDLPSLPSFAQTDQWKKINWLINHIGLAGTNNQFPGYLWSDLQGAIWLLDQPVPWNGQALGGVPALTSMMTNMANAALANYQNFVIPTGGWGCIVFIPQGATSLHQTQAMFIKVDP